MLFFSTQEFTWSCTIDMFFDKCNIFLGDKFHRPLAGTDLSRDKAFYGPAQQELGSIPRIWDLGGIEPLNPKPWPPDMTDSWRGSDFHGSHVLFMLNYTCSSNVQLRWVIVLYNCWNFVKQPLKGIPTPAFLIYAYKNILVIIKGEG